MPSDIHAINKFGTVTTADKIGYSHKMDYLDVGGLHFLVWMSLGIFERIWIKKTWKIPYSRSNTITNSFFQSWCPVLLLLTTVNFQVEPQYFLLKLVDQFMFRMDFSVNTWNIITLISRYSYIRRFEKIIASMAKPSLKKIFQVFKQQIHYTEAVSEENLEGWGILEVLFQ